MARTLKVTSKPEPQETEKYQMKTIPSGVIPSYCLPKCFKDNKMTLGAPAPGRVLLTAEHRAGVPGSYCENPPRHWNPLPPPVLLYTGNWGDVSEASASPLPGRISLSLSNFSKQQLSVFEKMQKLPFESMQMRAESIHYFPPDPHALLSKCQTCRIGGKCANILSS